MWLDAHAISAGLQSGHRALVAESLAALRACVECLDLPPIPAPDAGCLQCFGGALPEAVRADFLAIAERGECFDPALTSADKVWVLLEAQALDDHSLCYALEASLLVKISANPERLLGAVFSRLIDGHLATTRARSIQSWLDFMLEGPAALRRATQTALLRRCSRTDAPAWLAVWLTENAQRFPARA